MPYRPDGEPGEITSLRLELERIGAIEVPHSGDGLGTWLYELPSDDEDFEVEVSRIGEGWIVGMCADGSPKVPVSWWLGAYTGTPVDVSVDLLSVGEPMAVIEAFVRSFDEIISSAGRLTPALEAMCAQSDDLAYLPGGVTGPGYAAACNRQRLAAAFNRQRLDERLGRPTDGPWLNYAPD